MNNFTKTYLARIIGVVIATIAARFAVKYGIQVDDKAQAKLVEDIVTWMQFVFGIIYAVSHRTVSKTTNGGDAASSHLATVENEEVSRLKGR
jgi:hypothetical protein